MASKVAPKTPSKPLKTTSIPISSTSTASSTPSSSKSKPAPKSLSTPAIKKPTQSNPVRPSPAPATSPAVTPSKAKVPVFKRPAPILKVPSAPNGLEKGMAIDVEDPTKQSHADKNAEFFEKLALGLETTEQDNLISEKLTDAFKDVNNLSAPSMWPRVQEALKRKIAEPREMYSRQTQKMQEQLQSQVFGMNERLVTQQDINDKLGREVQQLRQQIQNMELQERKNSMLHRSLHINLQAALDHLQVSSKLLVEGKLDGEEVENEEDNPIYSKPETPNRDVETPVLLDALRAGSPVSRPQSKVESYKNDFISPSETYESMADSEEQIEGHAEREEEIERETKTEENEILDLRGDADARDQKGLVPMGGSEIVDEDAGYEFFV